MHSSWRLLKFWKHYRDVILPKLEAEEQAGVVIYPPRADWFNALKLGMDDVKVVIVGQDPYPKKGQAHGYAFSAQPHCRPLPHALRTIFKEYKDDLGYKAPSSGDLRTWAERGVLLLNTAFTVRENEPKSHIKYWSILTYEILSRLSRRRKRLVFMLWGDQAQQYRGLIDQKKHLVLTADHPSPARKRNGSNPLVGSKPFSKACEFLNITPEELWKLHG